MFNLEKSIAAWKKSLYINPSLEDGYIEELESHLRDKIEDYTAREMSEESAFKKAIAEIGEPEQIGAEFFKSDTTNKLSGRPAWQKSRFAPTLFFNYLKVGIRNFRKQKGFSLINILGLAAGLTCVILISMVILYELSFDGFIANKKNIYRVLTKVNRTASSETMAPVMLPFAPLAQEEIPEIKKAVRISEKQILSTFGEKSFYERAQYVDSGFFKVFGFRFLEGDPNTALADPKSVVLTEEAAEKYFGDGNPIGKLLQINRDDLYRVTGVIKNIPPNTHLKGNFFVSFSTYNKDNNPRLNDWGSFSNDYTYVLLKPNSDPQVVEKKFAAMLKSRLEKSYYERYRMLLQPLGDIHLTDDIVYDNAKTVSKTVLLAFGLIALFILVIAIINFINLTTARSARRNKEVGIRKVAGAGRGQLIRQFLSESFLISFSAFLISLFLVELLLPSLRSLTGEDIQFSILFNGTAVIITAAILVFTTISAGAYPAFILSGIKPALVLKNSILKKKKGYSLRATLVVFQFAVAVLLVIVTITIYMQLNFMMTKDLGFPSDRIVVLRLKDQALMRNGRAFKEALLANHNIIAASYSNGTPGSNTSETSNFNPKGGNKNDERQLQYLHVDYDFLKTYGLRMKEGRFFSPDLSSDSAKAYILNETAVKKFGWQDAIGKIITRGGNDDEAEWKKIIGVMQDFNYSSLKQNIKPMAIAVGSGGNRYLSMQLNASDINGTINFIKKVYARYSPGYPFDYYFLKDQFAKYYRDGETVGKLLLVFTGMAIFISLIGILGLVAYSTEQKSKEIGIRKVLGASSGNIVFMLCRQFIKWVLISNIVIWPVSYLITDKFLDSFAYRINFNFTVLILTLFITLFLTVAAVGYHSIKAALSNPVNSLKYE